MTLLSILPEWAAIWQQTLRRTDFDPTELEERHRRNARPAYGLTLVADFPLPPDLLAGLGRLRDVGRRVFGDAAEWYRDDHLHLTVYSLMRSRSEPLPESELEKVRTDWLPRLRQLAGRASSLSVPLRGLAVTAGGVVLVCGARTEGLRRLQEEVSRLPGVAAPRDFPPHITLGWLKRPLGSAETFRRAMAALHRHAADPAGTLRPSRLRVLYYRSRLLDRVVWSVAVPLGRRAGAVLDVAATA